MEAYQDNVEQEGWQIVTDQLVEIVQKLIKFVGIASIFSNGTTKTINSIKNDARYETRQVKR